MSSEEVVPVEVRSACDEDIDAIYGIHLRSFSRPWPREEFVKERQRACGRLRVAVASEAARIVGYSSSWRVCDEMQLMSVAVDPAFRGRGVGDRLMEDLVAVAHEERCATIQLEVRRSHRVALALYRRWQFAEVGVRENYYGDGGEAAVLMSRSIP